MTKIIEPPSERKPKPAPPTQVRRSVRRLEGRAKVDGSIEYILNLTLPGMLHGKILRAPSFGLQSKPAKLKSVDSDAAKAMEGVVVVRDGDVIYRRASGYADREAERPMRDDAILFTSTALEGGVGAFVPAIRDAVYG